MLAIKHLSLLCARRCMDQSNLQFTGVLGLSGTLSPKLPIPLRDRRPQVTHCSSGQAHSSPQTASRSAQPFLYRSQMLCCTMHCQWGNKTPKTARPLVILSPCRRTNTLVVSAMLSIHTLSCITHVSTHVHVVSSHFMGITTAAALANERDNSNINKLNITKSSSQTCTIQKIHKNRISQH